MKTDFDQNIPLCHPLYPFIITEINNTIMAIDSIIPKDRSIRSMNFIGSA